jgi:hypothetical protein
LDSNKGVKKYMENKTVVTAVSAILIAGALTVPLVLNPVTQQTTAPDPTPTATIEVIVTPTPTATLAPSATPTHTPIVTATPKPTAKAQSATPTPHVATIEDYAIRTILEDGTVVVTYAPDTPLELLESIMPTKKGVNK